MGDAGHRLGVLGTHPSEVGRNSFEDDDGFLGAKFLGKPDGGGFFVFALVARRAKDDHISRYGAWAGRIGEWYPVIGMGGMKQSIKMAFADSAAVTEILDGAPIVFGGEIIRKPKLLASPPLTTAPVYISESSRVLLGVLHLVRLHFVWILLFPAHVSIFVSGGPLAGDSLSLVRVPFDPFSSLFIVLLAVVLVVGSVGVSLMLPVFLCPLFDLCLVAFLADIAKSVRHRFVTMEVLRCCREFTIARGASLEDFRHVSLHNGYSSIGATDGQGRYGDTLFGWMISHNLVLSI